MLDYLNDLNWTVIAGCCTIVGVVIAILSLFKKNVTIVNDEEKIKDIAKQIVKEETADSLPKVTVHTSVNGERIMTIHSHKQQPKK